MTSAPTAPYFICSGHSTFHMPHTGLATEGIGLSMLSFQIRPTLLSFLYLQVLEKFPPTLAKDIWATNSQGEPSLQQLQLQLQHHPLHGCECIQKEIFHLKIISVLTTQDEEVYCLCSLGQCQSYGLALYFRLVMIYSTPKYAECKPNLKFHA